MDGFLKIICLAMAATIALALPVPSAAAQEQTATPQIAAAVNPLASRPLAPEPYAGSLGLPIDLATTLRLASASNPAIVLAQARVREAQARQDQADLLFLPNFALGGAYLRHDGQIQDTRGLVFTSSRASVFDGGGPQLRVDTADAYFLPLVTQQLTAAQAAGAQSVTNLVELEAALAYYDVLQVFAAMAINADTLARAEQMLDRARAADKAGLIKTKGDVPRAATEVSLRKQEAFDLRGRAGAASARLARVLLLPPTVELRPADPAVVPVTLVPAEQSLDELVLLAIQHRPELAGQRALVRAVGEQLRQARLAPLLPKLQVDYLGGIFAGGHNDKIRDAGGRGDLGAQAYWEVKNLGLGNRAQVRERQATVEQANARVAEIQAQVASEVVESARLAAARFAAVTEAAEAVKEATELYRRLQATSFGMIGPRAQYDALEPLLAIQALNQARVQYLSQVIEFDKAQLRLYTALGQPPESALPDARPEPLQTPVSPPPFKANEKP